MSKTIMVAGFGPGISNAVAERFGKEGFAVGLVARNADRLAAGVAALEAKGIRAKAFPADLSKTDAVRAVVGKVHDTLGPISVVHWNAYGSGGGNVVSGDEAGLRNQLDVAVLGLSTAVTAALADLRAQGGAVLATNGGLGLFVDQMDAVGAQYELMGLSIANSAKHKLVRLLAKKLASEGVFVGEVMVTGTVKGSAFDQGNSPTTDPAIIAAAFWDMYQARSANFAKL